MGMRKDSLNPSNNQTGFERREKRKKKKSNLNGVLSSVCWERPESTRGVLRGRLFLKLWAGLQIGVGEMGEGRNEVFPSLFTSQSAPGYRPSTQSHQILNISYPELRVCAIP